MCLRCQLNIFLFFDLSNSDVSLIDSGFNNIHFSSDTKIFSGENLRPFFAKGNSLETPFNNSDHPVSIDTKCYDINDFNKLIINKNSSLATPHLNTDSLSKHLEDLQKFPILKHSFDIIGISEHKITKSLKKSAFNSPGYTFCFKETETSHGGTGLFFYQLYLQTMTRPLHQ